MVDSSLMASAALSPTRSENPRVAGSIPSLVPWRAMFLIGNIDALFAK